MLDFHAENHVATIALNDPARRNALSQAMFDALDAALADIALRDDVHVVLLRGEGPVFCAGFDLAAVVETPRLMKEFIMRLHAINLAVRRLPQVVVAAAHGAAIAGGCALLSACDFVVVSRETKLGYPVHRIGVSPAVTIPTLQPMIGSGAARALLMSGELIDGARAHQLGLATHLCGTDEDVLPAAQKHCALLASHGPHALRATKAWINELEGSLDEASSAKPARGSAKLAGGNEATAMLRDFWQARPKR